MKTNTNSYNGHKNYDFWNVSLWISNDEPNYHTAMACLGSTDTVKEAAEDLLATLPTHTPDGVKYTLENLEMAISELAESLRFCKVGHRMSVSDLPE